MSKTEKDEGELGTLTVLYDETRRSLDQQIERAESLTSRAQQILGFSIVIVSVIAAIDLRNGDGDFLRGLGFVRGLGLLSLGLFVAAAALGLLAWRFQSYRDDPKPSTLYTKHRHSDEAAMRDQVIGNRLAAMRANAKILNRRKKLIDAALWVLAAGVVALVSLVTVRAFSGDATRPSAGLAWNCGKEEGQGEEGQDKDRAGRRGRAAAPGPPAHQGPHCRGWHREGK